MKVKVIKTKEYPFCPICGANMHLLRKINSRVTEWWGCTSFPKCKGYLSLDDAYHYFVVKKKKDMRFEERKRVSENFLHVSSKRRGINYYQYINSPEWKQKSEDAKKRARYRCQVCNRNTFEVVLNTHHRTYDRLGFEMEEDLIVLCNDCHKLFHKNRKIKSYKSQ